MKRNLLALSLLSMALSLSLAALTGCGDAKDTTTPVQNVSETDHDGHAHGEEGHHEGDGHEHGEEGHHEGDGDSGTHDDKEGHHEGDAEHEHEDDGHDKDEEGHHDKDGEGHDKD